MNRKVFYQYAFIYFLIHLHSNLLNEDSTYNLGLNKRETQRIKLEKENNLHDKHTYHFSIIDAAPYHIRHG